MTKTATHALALAAGVTTRSTLETADTRRGALLLAGRIEAFCDSILSTVATEKVFFQDKAGEKV